MEFVKGRSRIGQFPGRIELDKVLGIHVYTYFKSMKELYKEANIDYDLHMKKVEQDRFHSSVKIQEQRQRIIDCIKKRNNEGYFIGIQEIQQKLKLSFYKYFNSPDEAYLMAGINYKRVCPIILGKTKEKLFTEIVIHLLVELGYTIQRVSLFDVLNFNKGADIHALDKNDRPVLIELKAYHKRYWITKREIDQLKKYMKNKGISRGVFITTANKANHNPKNINIINGNKLISLLQKNGLDKYIKKIKWVQEEKVNHIARKIFHQKRRDEIIAFVLSQKYTPSQTQIEKNLRLSLKTYFESPPYRSLLNEIKKFSSDSGQTCKAPSRELQYTLPARE
jgi:hypothetical protein